MADVRVVQNMVITDPTTPTQLAAVDASGRLSVSLAASSATVTVDTELPAAAALADATSNPTVPATGSFLMGYNGATWDRLRTTGTGVLQVDTELIAVAALADAFANPTVTSLGADLSGFNGTTWDRLRTVDSTDAAPNVRTGILAVGTGPGFDVKFNPANLGTAANSAVTNTVDGADEVSYNVGTTTTGTYTFEVSGDDSTWVAAVWYNKKTGVLSSGNLTPTSGDEYAVIVSGWRQVRARTVSTLGATVALKTTHSLGYTVEGLAIIMATAADAMANPNGSQDLVYLFGYNGATWDRLKSSTANGLQVDVTRVTGTVTVDTELTAVAALADGTANPTITNIAGFNFLYNGSTWDRARGAATLADALANPGTGLAQDQVFLMGYNGSTWDRVRTANTGRLQVDVITGGGTDTPTTPINSYQTSAALAAGSSVTLASASQTSATTKLSNVVVGASVATRNEIGYQSNSVKTILGVVFAGAGQSFEFGPRHRNYWSVAFAGAGTNQWQNIVTNLDASEAADVYTTFWYEN